MKYIMISMGLVFSSLCHATNSYSEGHPLISTYEGAELWKSKRSDYIELEFPVGPIDKDSNSKNLIKVGGKGYFHQYNLPESANLLSAIANYSQALEVAGFTKIFQCTGVKCGNKINEHIQSRKTNLIVEFHEDDSEIVLFKAERGSGDIYVFFHMRSAFYGPKVYQTVLEVNTLQLGKVKIDKEYLSAEVSAEGRVVLHGLEFQFDSDEITTTSAEVIRELAEYLRQNKTQSFYVVGHTDDIGGEDYNVKLSQRRAEAVVRSLSKKHGIDIARITPRGVGPWAPIKRNSEESSLQVNRRVELVLSLNK